VLTLAASIDSGRASLAIFGLGEGLVGRDTIHGVKPLPAGLPPANSRKWHQRRTWDSLGYLRVRSLGNPGWDRDIAWLVGWLQRERDQAGAVDRDLYDHALVALRRYPSTASGVRDPGQAWDDVLAPIDEILVRRQVRHLAHVRQAQREQHNPDGFLTVEPAADQQRDSASGTDSR
jgi:hypothetical protein